MKYDTLFLENKYLNWFDPYNSAVNKTIHAEFNSVNGLSESMTSSKYNVLYNEFVINNELKLSNLDPCTYSLSQGYLITYLSNMYKFSFDVKVYRFLDGMHICIRDFGSIKFGFMIFDYNIDTDKGLNTIYFDDGNKKSNFTPTLKPDNIVIHGKNYSVFKIINTLAVHEGNDLDITAFYLEQNLGIVKFEQKNGTVWEIGN
jgi:hypothetical protein